jgi:hypothetical protein
MDKRYSRAKLQLYSNELKNFRYFTFLYVYKNEK